MREKECTEFIANIPTVWNETQVLDAKVSEYIAMARQHDDIWYLGALTNWEPREMELDLSLHNHPKITLEVNVSNPAALRLYQKNKFEPVRTINNYYADGSNAYSMHLEVGYL